MVSVWHHICLACQQSAYKVGVSKVWKGSMRTILTVSNDYCEILFLELSPQFICNGIIIISGIKYHSQSHSLQSQTIWHR